MGHKGQNLIETVLMFSVIIIGAIVVLTLLGNNVGNMYRMATDSTNEYKPFGELTTQNKNGPGPLGGTSANPVKQCTSGTCNIDYGQFMLTGIPENFGELVKTTGTSGGTDSLMNLIEQIANKLEQDGDINGAKEYRQLANLGHFIADVQATNETSTQTCAATQTGYDIYKCMGTDLQKQNNFTLPADLKDVLPNYDTSAALTTLTYNTEIGMARYNKVSGSSQDPQAIPATAFVNLFDSIMANPKYSDTMKGITQELYLNIADLTQTHSANVHGAEGFNNHVSAATNIAGFGGFTMDSPATSYDPLTGAASTYRLYWGATSFDGIVHPSSSVGTDVNSALICAAGWNKDTGSNCHQ